MLYRIIVKVKRLEDVEISKSIFSTIMGMVWQWCCFAF